MSNRHQNSHFSVAFALLACFVITVLGACGIITDKDRIRVARVGGEYITRGDLQEAISNMPTKERPEIRTRGDLRAALAEIIDERIKRGQAEALKAQGKIHVERQEAEMQFAMRNREEYSQYLSAKNLFTKEDFAVLDEEIQIEIDREEERLYGQRALIYLITEAVQNGTLVPTDDDYAEQYEMRKSQLLTDEQVAIRGVYFPIAVHGEQGATAEAARVQEEMKSGADPEAIAKRYGPEKAGFLEVGLANNSPDPKFTSFWDQASESTEGDVVSCFIPGWQRTVVVAGETKLEPIPDSLLVCRIERYVPRQQKTLEQAKPDLSSAILYSAMMEQLRDKAQVEIYDDKLPDPGIYDTSSSGMFEN